MTQLTNSRHGAALGTIRLSPREAEILVLIAQGLRSIDAAEALSVSKRTVDFHLANVYEKLGVSNRISALRCAGRMGLVPFEPGPKMEVSEPPVSSDPRGVTLTVR
jgi:DNA-binding NarL/FixJ family response regulator